VSEIFYVNGTRLIAARLDVSAGVRVVSQRTVQESFAVPVYGDHDVSPDGQKIALVRPVDLEAARRRAIAPLMPEPEPDVAPFIHVQPIFGQRRVQGRVRLHCSTPGPTANERPVGRVVRVFRPYAGGARRRR
jgi:hypothetical protein